MQRRLLNFNENELSSQLFEVWHLVEPEHYVNKRNDVASPSKNECLNR